MKWISGDRTISQSRHHQDMFIVDVGDGKFYTINTSLECALKQFPRTDIGSSDLTFKKLYGFNLKNYHAGIRRH